MSLSHNSKASPKRRRLVLLIFVVLVSFFTYTWMMRKEMQDNLQRFMRSQTNFPFRNFFGFTGVNSIENNRPIINMSALIINTPGCKIPKLDPWDPSVSGLIKLKEPYKCKGNTLYLSTAPNGSIIINPKSTRYKESDFACSYQGIRRKHETADSKREVHYKFTNSAPLRFGVDLKEDYVKVDCLIKGIKVFRHYYPLARLKDSVEKKKSTSNLPTPQLNILLVGIDSVSKLNFLRHLRRTHEFLLKTLSPFDMKGYTKVGENTFPNLIPMLTGHFYGKYWNESVRNTMFWDEVDLVWKAYAARGYRTFYAEDMPLFGTFQYEKRGFYDPPTDYYFRPLALAIYYSKLKKNSREHCLNSQLDVDIIYTYLKDFIRAMDTRPFFAFAMVSTLTHDVLNYASFVDQPTAQLLDDISQSGAFNKTVLFLFSDHGIRFGPIRKTYIGKFEERMPFMYIHFPKWFLQKYPEVARNLNSNQKRLMTFFDVHETLLNLLDFHPEESKFNKTDSRLGSSLLQEISENRTCSDANILPHWCPCQTYETVQPSQNVSLKSAQEIVNNINSQLSEHKDICADLSVDNVTDAQRTRANELILKPVKSKSSDKDTEDRVIPIDRYLITLITKPGGAMFEGTVQHDSERNVFKVLGISRINMYGNQSECIDIHKLKIFCYCISLTVVD